MSSMKLSTKLVKRPPSIVQKQEHKNLIDYIFEELKSIHDSDDRLNPTFLKYLSEIIENQVDRVPITLSAKPNKMLILVDILKKLFPNITDAEIENSKTIIEFLLSEKLIKKSKLSDVFVHYITKRFFGQA